MTSPQITTLPLARTPFTNNKGSNNTADGHQALQNNTTGTNNVAVDFQAGNNLTTGSNNIAIGAGVTGVAGEANTTRIGKSTQAKTLIGGIYGKTVASGTAVTCESIPLANSERYFPLRALKKLSNQWTKQVRLFLN